MEICVLERRFRIRTLSALPEDTCDFCGHLWPPWAPVLTCTCPYLVFMYVSIFLAHTYMCHMLTLCLWKSEEDIRHVCEPPCEGWEPNQGLCTEPSLQALKKFF